MNRREFIKLAFATGAGTLSSRWLPAFGENAKAKAVILLWMQGGPSQLETWDPKPGQETGGPTKALDTGLGFSISEHLPRLAKSAKRFSLVRTLHSKDPNHDTARYLLHTGHRIDTTVEHPHLGSVINKELGRPDGGLPGCVAVGPVDARIGAGYLAAEFAPFHVEKIESPLEDLTLPPGVNKFRLGDRERLLDEQNRGFEKTHPDASVQRTAAERALALVRSKHVRAFDVSDEPESVRRIYGDSAFGRACLMARRLVANGVKFVEVALGDWDTHADNFNRSGALCRQLDGGMTGLLEDLEGQGMLADTLVVCTGEFGRTPRVNPANGRDHWTRSFSAALAGAGIAGGRVVGRTNEPGTEIVERPVTVQDLFATIYGQLGIDPRKEHTAPNGRPIAVLDGGSPMKELLS